MRKNEFDKFSLEELNEGNYNDYKEDYIMKVIVKNLLTTISIMILSTLLSFLFRYIGFHESNVIVAFILGVLFVAKYTEGYYYGVFASVIGVLSFNFFFTEPYYTFLAYRADYPITFIIMLIAAIVTSTLTSQVKKEARISFIREKRIKMLYRINKGLLKARNINQIVEFCGKNLVDMFSRTVIITMANSGEYLEESCVYAFNNDDRANIFQSAFEQQIIAQSYENAKVIGRGTETFSSSAAYYHPIKGQKDILGVIGIACFQNAPLSENEKILLGSVSTQIALAIERENLFEKQQKSNLEAERERLRGNLLRSISHDLRTPLTGILGAVSTILDNEEVIDNKVKRELLQNIYGDTNWLVHSIENILSMTRIDEGKLEIKKNMEIIEEIIAEAVSRVRKFAVNHTIKIDVPQNIIILPVDGLLIEQVIVNLIDNAIKYTPDGSVISIIACEEKNKVIIEVSDNGKGIPKEDIPSIFNRFYSNTKIGYAERRGIGLGLAICKSIITAHDGEIFAFNNSSGGATFRFTLPLKE